MPQEPAEDWTIVDFDKVRKIYAMVLRLELFI